MERTSANKGGESEHAPTSEDEEEEEQGKSEDSGEHKSSKIEPWHVWVERITRIGLKEMQKAHVEDWVVAA